jgi:hypothetical protein
MKRHGWVLCVLLVGGIQVGCSKNQAPAQTVAAVPAQVQPDPMDELKRMGTALRTELDSAMQPVNEVDALLSEVGTLPARLRIEPSELRAVLVAKFKGNGVNLKGELAERQKVKIQIDVLLARVDGVVWGLKAMPSRAAALAETCGAAVAKVPVLASKVSASANATLSNPAANAEAKARAKADMAAVAKVQAEIEATIQDVQTKVTALPTLANEALVKLTTSFSS